MDARFLICSESLALDIRKSTLSLFHIMEQINVPLFPFILPAMAIALLLVREPNETTDSEESSFIRIETANQEVFRHAVPLRFQGKNILRTAFELSGLLIPAPGEIRIEYFYKEKRLGVWSIQVNSISNIATQEELPLPDTGQISKK